MNIIQALIVVIVLIAVVWAIKTILDKKPKQTGPCVPAVSNIILPANQASTTIACCQDQNNQCLGGYSSEWGTVALIPTKLSASCPIQVLTPDEYSSALPSAGGNEPVTVNMQQLGGLYTKGTNCGDIQAAVTRLCYPTGGISGDKYDPSGCKGGIAAVAADTSQTISCPPGTLVQPTRRILMPMDFSKATCESDCCYTDLDTGSPVGSVTINATADAKAAGGAPCTSSDCCDEILFYQCQAPPGS